MREEDALECAQCRIRHLALFRPIAPAELASIAAARSAVRLLPKGAQILPGDLHQDELYTLHAGWAFSYKISGEGKRQIIDFHLPGDFLGLEQASVAESGSAIEALTAVRLCVFPRARLFEHAARNSALAASLTETSGRREAVLAEHIQDLGSRNAAGKIAHLLLELVARQGLPRRGTMRCDFPPSQIHLADALGLTAEHVSRTLREFREKGWASIRHRMLTISDFPALAALADWSDRYLAPRALI